MAVVLSTAGLIAFVHAQDRTPDYRELGRRAGIIFQGTVGAVERIPPAGADGIAALRVTFRVEHAVRGVTPGQVLSINEWDHGSPLPPYRTGERLLLFLYPPSGELGFTSPVGGGEGRVRGEQSDAVLAAISDSDRTKRSPRQRDLGGTVQAGRPRRTGAE